MPTHYNDYSDIRLGGHCIYCNILTDSRDHLPPRLWLNEPFPENLQILSICRKCNARFSSDEAYVACLIECAGNKTVNVQQLKRGKVSKVLERSPELRRMLSLNRQQTFTKNYGFVIDKKRVKNIICKLARGHASYELSERNLDAPRCVFIKPFSRLGDLGKKDFEQNSHSTHLSEIGSRAMQRLMSDDWVVVQSGQYRYYAGIVYNEIIVKIIIGEYLACCVAWENSDMECVTKEEIDLVWY